MNWIENCWCNEPSKEDVERTIREVEEDEQPTVIPIEVPDVEEGEPIPVLIPVRRQRELVEVE